MHEFRLKTAVAFIVFNRPDTTERVFAEIAKAKPPKLLVVGDGARVDREGEAAKVSLVRSIIDRVDWDCDVLTNFSDTNLGCKRRVSSGIDWIFEQVEEAIILEDDCLPDPTFFRFCQELLEKYRDDKRIGLVSGDNFQFGRRYSRDSYYFSKYIHIWGWATWRDRWRESYDVALKNWPNIREQSPLVEMMGNTQESIFWQQIFQRVYENKIDTWDYQWIYANWINGRMCILPSVNLISNIGFGNEATHTLSGSEVANMPVVPMKFPLEHPGSISRNISADSNYQNKLLCPSLWTRIVKKVARLLA